MSASAAPATAPTAQDDLDQLARCELIRALGAICLSPPPASDAVCDALALPRCDPASHTDAFVLLAPPYAAIHLGPEGKLGGVGADRVAGFWRAIAQHVPREADHLGVLLMGYAHLAQQLDEPGARRAAATLFHEHIWAFAPGYLAAVAAVAAHPVRAWAQLTHEVLSAESATLGAPARLPLALREAPACLAGDASLDDLLDAMVAPVRSGIVVTHHDLATAARELGMGYRRGERRYALKAMIEQDKPATLAMLATRARLWSRRHLDIDPGTETGRWWARRAGATAEVLASFAEGAS